MSEKTKCNICGTEMKLSRANSTPAAPFWICQKEGCGGFGWGYPPKVKQAKVN